MKKKLFCLFTVLLISFCSISVFANVEVPVEFNIMPKSAILVVDGKQVKLFDGYAVVMLDYGKHEWRASADCYETEKRKFKLTENSQKITENINLTPNFGWLKIDMTDVPVDAEIYVDGKRTTFASVNRDSLAKGTHEVSVIKPLYIPYSKKIKISAGETISLAPALTTNLAIAKIVVPNDTLSQIWIDGSKVSDNGEWYGALSSGQHMVEAKKKYCKSTTQQLLVSNNDVGIEKTYYLDIPEPLYGEYSIKSVPYGAKVYIDDLLVGTTPCQGQIQFGSHEVKVAKTGYFIRYSTIHINQPETTSFDFNLDDINDVRIAPNSLNGHEYVDLGLSVKWATCNLGAESPSDYGDYFAWGEIEAKTDFKRDNSVAYGRKFSDISGSIEYDAAKANWGGTWRMPTVKEFKELLDQCTWEKIALDGHKVYKVTSKKNGNYIFLPLSGSMDKFHSDKDKRGFYWTSSPDPNDLDDMAALIIQFGDIKSRAYWDYRFLGNTIRPVTK